MSTEPTAEAVERAYEAWPDKPAVYQVTDRFQPFITYIKNTGHIPLKTEWFDEDHEPIGPTVRRDLLAAGLITIAEDGIRLTETTDAQ